MGFLGSGDPGHPVMNLINFGLRVCQFALATATLGLYTYEIKVEEQWCYGNHYPKTVTAIVVSCLSFITATIFGILPFITADYFHVAVCFLWDFVILCIWCAVFGFFHAMFQYPYDTANDLCGGRISKDWWERNQATVWVDLTCLLLWLTTTVLGIIGLAVSRCGRRAPIV